MEDLLNNKTYVCDYIDLIRNLNTDEHISCYLDNIQFLVQRMEDVLIERKNRLTEEGYMKCPSCGSMSKPELNCYKCCGYIEEY